MINSDFLIIALDVPGKEQASSLIRATTNQCNFYKIGMQVFYKRWGMDVVNYLKDLGKKVMLDLKINDIPNTVTEAVRSVSELGVDYLTLFCNNATIESAKAVKSGLKLIQITHLTSNPRLPDHNEFISMVSHASTADGFVCAVEDISNIRKENKEALIICPGIRPQGSDVNDQVLVASPGDAYLAGATHIVVGRPIVQSDHPSKVIDDIYREIENVKI